jgi:sugar/nucleoside kinase (ribokinase family)
VRGAAPDQPSRAVIESARVLFLDFFGMVGNVRAARIARAAGVAIVSDLERTQLPRMRTLVDLIDHPIFSQRAAEELTGETNPARAAARIWKHTREAVIVTCGGQGAWFVSRAQPRPRRLPAFQVKALDTTGCGDVFHGAYAAALAKGWPLEERLRFASAAAALKATQRGGQAGIPSEREVRKFLARSGK